MTKLQLIRIRAETGLSQADFGSNIGYKQNSISEYENGKKITPKLEKLISLFYKEAFDSIVKR